MPLSGIFRFYQTYRNIGRIRQIVNVLIRHGFGQFIEQINLQRFIPLRKRLRVFGQWPAIERHTMPERLRMAFSELGPSFIKLAQLLSSRPDLITPAYADEFKKLQDRVPPFPTDVAKRTIEAELNIRLDDVFSEFGDVPIAAASIAQVHNATLKDGTKVIVKVQRPEIREVIETDISILNAIARLMLKYIPESRLFNPEGIVDEFSRTIRKELDFILEAKNAQRFKKNFAGYKGICIPTIYNDLTTERVIVMERFEGVRIDDIEGIDELGINRVELARRGVDIYFKMIFEDGFFHADPHPGNIFALPDARIALMDFGIVGWVTEDMMERMANAFMAIIKRDFDMLINQYIELGIVSEAVDIERFKREFKAELIDVLQPLYDLTISEIKLADYLETLTHLAIKHGLTMPSELLLMNKTMLILDNIGRGLDPDFNLFSVAEPYASRLARRRMSPLRLLEEARKDFSEIKELAQTMPRQLNIFLRRALREELSFKVNPIGMDRLIRDIDRSSNRLAFSVIVASIIIGSTMLIQSGPEGEALGLPTIGAMGFFIAFILGIWLLVSIIKSGRL
ncbi:MAG: AarF/ABC1/UbiB kinase family protein [Thermodesulfovibrionia bacterium]